MSSAPWPAVVSTSPIYQSLWSARSDAAPEAGRLADLPPMKAAPNQGNPLYRLARARNPAAPRAAPPVASHAQALSRPGPQAMPRSELLVVQPQSRCQSPLSLGAA
jgi:hypothetical protein